MTWLYGACFLSTNRISCENFGFMFSLFPCGHRLLWSDSFKFAKLYSVTTLFYFTCMGILLICMTVYHLHVWWLWRTEKGFRSLELETHKVVSHNVVLGIKPGSSGSACSQYPLLISHVFSAPSPWDFFWGTVYLCVCPCELLNTVCFAVRQNGLSVETGFCSWQCVMKFPFDSTDYLSSTLVS